MRHIFTIGLLGGIVLSATMFSACGGSESGCDTLCVAPTVVITEGESVTYDVAVSSKKQRTEVSKSNNTIRVKSTDNQEVLLNYTVPDCSCGTYAVEKNKTLSPIESYLVGKAYQSEVGLVELLVKNGTDSAQQKDLTITTSQETEEPNAKVLGYTFDTMVTSKTSVSDGSTVYVLEMKQVMPNSKAIPIPNDGLTYAKVTNQETKEVLLEISLTHWNGV